MVPTLSATVGRWSARGDSNPDLHGLNVPRHGSRTRRAALTPRRGIGAIPGIEPGRRPYQGRRLPLHQISVGANGGTRTRTSRLGRISIVDIRTERGLVTFTGPGTPVSCQRTCSCELVGGKGFEPNRSGGERVYGPSADHPLVPPFRRRDFSLAWRAVSAAGQTKTKKAFQGVAPEGLFLDECRAFRALSPPYRARRRCGASSGRVSWICAHWGRRTRSWPNRMAVLATGTAS
jgi:hypothetical protein